MLFGGELVNITAAALSRVCIWRWPIHDPAADRGFMTVCTRRLQGLLERRSTLDPLTQVLNRRGFADIYAKELPLMRRQAP
jgi:GGDEF domain-containing protein